MQPQSRRHDRYQSTLTVRVGGDGTQRYGTIYQISAGGAFLEVSPLPVVGTLVEIVVVVDGASHALGAEVRYRCAGDAGPRGIDGVGVAWTDLNAEQRAVVDTVLERAQAQQPLRG